MRFRYLIMNVFAPKGEGQVSGVETKVSAQPIPMAGVYTKENWLPEVEAGGERCHRWRRVTP
jgi:hypothetical protein